MPRHLHGRRLPPALMHDLPLDAEERELLDAYLREQRAGEVWTFMELDGYITAVVVLPTTQLPADSYGAIFGGQGDEETVARVMAAEARGIVPLVLRHWRTVRLRPQATERWSLPDTLDDATVRSYDWSLGFLQGIRLNEAVWARHMDANRYQELLLPVLDVFERMYHELVGRVSPMERLHPPASPREHAQYRRDLILAAGDFYLECRRRKSA